MDENGHPITLVDIIVRAETDPVMNMGANGQPKQASHFDAGRAETHRIRLSFSGKQPSGFILIRTCVTGQTCPSPAPFKTSRS